MPRSKPHIVVFFGGEAPTYPLSRETGFWLCQYIPRDRYQVTPVHVLPDGRWQVPLGSLPQQGPVNRMMEQLFSGLPASSPHEGWQRLVRRPISALLSVLRGRGGDDGTLHSAGALFDIPVLGSSAATCHQTYHKQLFRHAVDDITSMPNSLYFTASTPLHEATDMIRDELLVPLFVKPAAAEGSAGTIPVDNVDDLESTLRTTLSQGDVLVQERTPGTEISLSMVPGPQGRPVLLPPTVIVPRAATFYDALAKQRPGRATLHTSDHQDNPLLYEAVAIAHDVYERLNCSGYTSFDFVADDDSVDLLEVNTVPVFNDATPLQQQLKVAGIHPGTFVDSIIRTQL